MNKNFLKHTLVQFTTFDGMIFLFEIVPFIFRNTKYFVQKQ